MRLPPGMVPSLRLVANDDDGPRPASVIYLRHGQAIARVTFWPEPSAFHPGATPCEDGPGCYEVETLAVQPALVPEPVPDPVPFFGFAASPARLGL